MAKGNLFPKVKVLAKGAFPAGQKQMALPGSRGFENYAIYEQKETAKRIAFGVLAVDLPHDL